MSDETQHDTPGLAIDLAQLEQDAEELFHLYLEAPDEQARNQVEILIYGRIIKPLWISTSTPDDEAEVAPDVAALEEDTVRHAHLIRAVMAMLLPVETFLDPDQERALAIAASILGAVYQMGWMARHARSIREGGTPHE